MFIVFTEATYLMTDEPPSGITWGGQGSGASASASASAGCATNQRHVSVEFALPERLTTYVRDGRTKDGRRPAPPSGGARTTSAVQRIVR